MMTILTTLGIALGTAVIIIVLSVMNGFQEELKKRILGAIPHIVLEQPTAFKDFENILNLIEMHPNVELAKEYLEGEGVINAGQNTLGAIFRGTDTTEISIFSENILDGSLKTLDDNTNAILGDSLSLSLGAFPAERVNVINANQINNFTNIPKLVVFNVSGTFSVGSEIDQNYVLIGKNSFRKLFMKEYGQGIEVKLKDVFKVDDTVKDLKEIINSDFYIKTTTWKEKYGGLFRATQLEKIMVSLLMGLILLTAIFSMMMSINMFVSDKRREIAILRTMGYSKNNILQIFLRMVVILGIVGVLLGNLLGVLFSTNITEFFQILSSVFGISMMSVYYVDYFPSIINPLQVLIVNVCALVLIGFFGLFPALKGASTKPGQVIR